ncbi:MAG: hypothetical protein ABSB74_12935 [Tepidisphaeraceae bacterium]
MISKATHKSVKFTPEEMAYELPGDIDVTKLRHVGKGAEVVQKLRKATRVGVKVADGRQRKQ